MNDEMISWGSRRSYDETWRGLQRGKDALAFGSTIVICKDGNNLSGCWFFRGRRHGADTRARKYLWWRRSIKGRVIGFGPRRIMFRKHGTGPLASAPDLRGERILNFFLMQEKRRRFRCYKHVFHCHNSFNQ